MIKHLKDCAAWLFMFMCIKPYVHYQEKKGHKLPPSSYAMDSESGEPIELE
jgi:hypothetical protein